MAFLNGTDVPDLLRLQTLITKFVGSIFSCAANLTVGTEGPLVHMGACIASVIAFWECGKQVNNVKHSTAQHSTAQHSTAQHGVKRPASSDLHKYQSMLHTHVHMHADVCSVNLHNGTTSVNTQCRSVCSVYQHAYQHWGALISSLHRCSTLVHFAAIQAVSRIQVLDQCEH